ncbi:PEP-CTERM sorting domain-containing protein [Mucisphaera calidilacus]|uniref:PEP-CTERM sorting domain-containing protein n=1 Tax=Mucisphaera calidilacus TaxID=2527982 RepID=A0A518C0X6_9BACT|nr:PEP-CTERM sorting domain-containing protein [Mucisphaera calidilacus]QDU72882.1 hypothetical protein Pan265_27580 [Mucisphaera calidilacus]
MNRITLSAAAALVAAAPAFAANVTPEVIFGSGNANGDFTVATGVGGSLELGLRGKLRFDSNNQPQNIFNYDGVDTYSFAPGTPPTGFGFAPNSPTTPIWNFEWSVNTDANGSGVNLDGGYTYELSLDVDPGAGTNFLTFDPINVASADHALGTNATGNGGGISDTANYATLLSSNNVAQNSWNYEFFNHLPPLDGFNPNTPGLYTISLTAFDGTAELVSTSININVVPTPAAFGAGMIGLLAVATRRGR